MTFQKATRGSSLVEVLIAAVLIGIATVAVFQAVSNSTRFSRQNFMQRIAYQRLEQILENPQHSYKGTPYANACVNDSGPLSDGIHSLGTDTLFDSDPYSTDDNVVADMSLIVTSIGPITASSTVLGTINNFYAKRLTARLIFTDQGVTDTAELQTIVTLVNIN